MRKCPFCNKEVSFEHPHISQLNDNSWVFYHYCGLETGKLNTVITIYGDTEEEIIAKWDGVYCAEEQTSESV